MHTEGHTHAHTDVPWRGWNVILNGVDRPAGSWVRSLFGGGGECFPFWADQIRTNHLVFWAHTEDLIF